MLTIIELISWIFTILEDELLFFQAIQLFKKAKWEKEKQWWGVWII